MGVETKWVGENHQYRHHDHVGGHHHHHHHYHHHHHRNDKDDKLAVEGCERSIRLGVQSLHHFDHPLFHNQNHIYDHDHDPSQPSTYNHYDHYDFDRDEKSSGPFDLSVGDSILQEHSHNYSITSVGTAFNGFYNCDDNFRKANHVVLTSAAPDGCRKPTPVPTTVHPCVPTPFPPGFQFSQPMSPRGQQCESSMVENTGLAPSSSSDGEANNDNLRRTAVFDRQCVNQKVRGQ